MSDRDVGRIHERLDEMCADMAAMRERLTVLETYRCVADEQKKDDRWIRRAIIQTVLTIVAAVVAGVTVVLLT